MAHRLLQNAVFDLYQSPHPRESAVERQLAAVVRKAINYFRHETITWSRFEDFREHMDALDARTREQALNHVIDTASRFLNVGDSVLAFAWIYAAVYDGGKAVISRSMLRLSRFKRRVVRLIEQQSAKGTLKVHAPRLHSCGVQK